MTARTPGRKKPSAGLIATDLGFRLGTGVFATMLVLRVVGHRIRAVAAIDAVDSEVRSQLLAHRRLGPGGRTIRGAPLHLGHSLLVDSGVVDLHADRARHRGLHLRALPRLAQAAAGFPDRAAGGDPVDCLRPVGHLCAGPRGTRVRIVAALRAAPAAVVQWSARGGRHAFGGAHPRRHGRPVLFVGGARSAEIGPRRAARGRVRARRDALRGDPRGALLCTHRHRRRRHAGIRPRPGRDHGGDDGDRQHAESVGVAVRAAGHHGRRAGEPVHRGRHRAVPQRTGRDWPRAVHHHADRQQPVPAADLEHGAERVGRALGSRG